MKRHHFVTNQRIEKQERNIAADIVAIDLNTIATSNSRSLGPELVGNSFWEKLQFDQREWRTLRSILSTHQRNTVMLTDAEDVIYHIRVSGSPETEHAEIYNRLSVKNPLKRMKCKLGTRK